MGRKTDTFDELNRIVQMFPDSADAYAARAAFETEQKQYDVALYDWDEAIRRKPLNEGFVVSKADILITLYRMDEARRCLNDAIKRGIPRYALKEWLDKCKRWFWWASQLTICIEMNGFWCKLITFWFRWLWISLQIDITRQILDSKWKLKRG